MQLPARDCIVDAGTQNLSTRKVTVFVYLKLVVIAIIVHTDNEITLSIVRHRYFVEAAFYLATSNNFIYGIGIRFVSDKQVYDCE